MELFKQDDFEVFDIQEFGVRMAAISTRIRPKLMSIGDELVPKLSALVDCSLFLHVARHARRTVNPPDDTWAAFGSHRRGYKKDVHFKFAVSRHCVRLLFEVGPEYYAKREWVRGWHAEFGDVSNRLREQRKLSWFKNEHDEVPALRLAELSDADLRRLPEELKRLRNDRGQFILGTCIEAGEFLKLKSKQVENLAVKTFEPLAPLFHIHAARIPA